MIVYKTISEYAKTKWISRISVYKRLERWEIEKFYIWEKYYFIDIKETLKYLMNKL